MNATYVDYDAVSNNFLTQAVCQLANRLREATETHVGCGLHKNDYDNDGVATLDVSFVKMLRRAFVISVNAVIQQHSS